MSKTDRVCVGSIAGSFGVRGDVRLKSYCSDPTAIADYGPLTTEDGSRSFTITLLGTLNNALSARLGGVKTRDEADALKGVNLYAERAKLPDLGDDEYYHADLIGMEVLDAGGTSIGKVKAVLNHGASDILEVLGPDMKSPLLLPFTLAVVPTVDLVGRRLIVDIPDEV